MKWPALFKCLCASLCVPLFAAAFPERIGEPDCRTLISHSGFAEAVVNADGGTHEIPIKVSSSAKWTVRNSGYVEWIKVVSGDSGTGTGTLTIRVEPNTGKYCRVGVLTISGLTRVYGLPITILQQGMATVAPEKQSRAPLPSVINLAPFSSDNSLAPSREYKKVNPRR